MHGSTFSTWSSGEKSSIGQLTTITCNNVFKLLSTEMSVIGFMLSDSRSILFQPERGVISLISLEHNLASVRFTNPERELISTILLD